MATRGAPTKRTKERVEGILRALRAGNTRTAAAEHLGIHRDTIANWMADNSAFFRAVMQAEAEAELRCATIITKAVMDGSTENAWKWLERRRHADWGKKEQIEHVGPGGGPLIIERQVIRDAPRALPELVS